MSVAELPARNDLRAGLAVEIEMEDQGTGRLTAGTIAEILKVFCFLK